MLGINPLRVQLGEIGQSWIGAIFVAASMLCAAGANATTFDYLGSVALCPASSAPCQAGLLSENDPLTGSIAVDDAAALPSSSFDFTDVTSFDFSVGLLSISSDSSSLVGGSVDTDAAGELVDGFLSILVPPGASGFNNPQSLLVLDLATATWIVLDLDPNLDVPTVTATGFGEFSLVPVPGGLLLLVSALGSFGWLRRKSAA